MSEKKTSIIDPMNEYRDCSRSLWNKYFMEKFQKDQDWSLVDSFKVIKEELFQSIVLIPIYDDSSNFTLGQPSKLITVELAENYKTTVKVNRNNNEFNNINYETAGYWDHPITELDSRVTLLFVDYFDWNSYGFLDMTLIMCEIIASPDNPDIEGHRMLVESGYIKDVVLNRSK